MSEPAIGSYSDTHGARHELVVHKTADGGWLVLDVDAHTTHVVETLAGAGWSSWRPATGAIRRQTIR